MQDQLPSWLPLTLGLIFVGATALRSVMLRVHDGINPYAIDHSRPLELFLQRIFVASTTTLLLFFMALALSLEIIVLLETGPAPYVVQIIGFALMVIAIGWTSYSQLSMGSSWRIGVPTVGAPTLFKTHGPFQLSRNPIFLGMLTFLVGTALWLPNELTVAVLVASYIAIEIQIRIEEAFLEGAHGEEYRRYQRRVRRWL